MCGICGFFGPGDNADVQAMSRAMVHRGPDAEGFWRDPERPLFLGHRRLSIIDIQGGGQPMLSIDGGLAIVFNGEIYNHAELRRELEAKGHVFRSSHSDTEMLLVGYREWGPSMCRRLNGMWAFAIYDRHSGRLFLSRDRFGKKPLYYTRSKDLFAFASELTALLEHRAVTPSISTRALKKYFAFGYIPAPHSLYEGVHKLPAGCNLTFHAADPEPRVETYWDFVIEPMDQVPDNPEAEWSDRIRDLLDRAVQRRLMSDVPLGVLLSGGVDSSSVAAFAARHVPEGSLKTFSIGFEEPSFDETPHARRMAALLRTDHFMETLSMDRAAQIAGDIVARLDEPMGDSSILPASLLCQITRKGVTVALGGDGGDELFAGYDPFRALALANAYAKLVPKPVHMGIRMAIARLPVSHRNMSLDFKLKRTLRGLSYPRPLWNPVWLGPLEPKELNELFNEPTDIEDVYEEALRCWEQCAQDNPIDKTLQFYTKLYLQDDILTKADRASMMHSLELRAPFLDIDLVDFVRRIPHTYKYRDGTTKYILKKALAPVLPDDILHRSKKGFGVPIGAWFQQGVLTLDDSPPHASLDAEFCQSKMARHTAGASDERAFLWNLWSLSRCLA